MRERIPPARTEAKDKGYQTSSEEKQKTASEGEDMVVKEQEQSEQVEGWEPQMWERKEAPLLSFWDLAIVMLLCLGIVATMPLWLPFWACQFVLGKVRRTR